MWTVGDDIAWIKPDANGQPARDQSRGRLLRRRAGHQSPRPIPNAMATLSRNTIFTNVALTPDGGVWWEGMTDEPPAECLDWQGKRWTPEIGKKTGAKAAHPNAPLHRARVAVPDHRSRTGKIPKACRSARSSSAAAAPRPCRWSTRRSTGARGVYIGATMGSETTAAAAGAVGKVRRDPMAMLPFCGYHMGDYFRHWIKMQRALERDAAHLPRELVPQGCRRQVPLARLRREHARAEVDRRPRAAAARWAARRRSAGCRATRTSTGTGSTSPREKFEQLQAVDRDAWRAEVIGHEELFIDLHDHLPPEMVYERELLICRL